jgi:hypothetical protein
MASLAAKTIALFAFGVKISLMRLFLSV